MRQILLQNAKAVYYKMRHAFFYEMRKIYYKVLRFYYLIRRLLQIATVRSNITVIINEFGKVSYYFIMNLKKCQS